jgi:hypothetical protein
MEPMLKFVAALVDVAVDIPETEVDEGGAEDAGEDEGDYEVDCWHDLGLPVQWYAVSSPKDRQ